MVTFDCLQGAVLVYNIYRVLLVFLGSLDLLEKQDLGFV